MSVSIKICCGDIQRPNAKKLIRIPLFTNLTVLHKVSIDPLLSSDCTNPKVLVKLLKPFTVFLFTLMDLAAAVVFLSKETEPLKDAMQSRTAERCSVIQMCAVQCSIEFKYLTEWQGGPEHCSHSSLRENCEVLSLG